jgi:uncharacterized OsmC-like protein
MASSSPQPRSVTLQRTARGRLTVINRRGGAITIGGGDDADFSPTELLLAAIGGCTALDVDALTSRRAEPERLELQVDADKIRDEDGNRLTNIITTFVVSFPDGDDGDAARAILPDVIAKSHDRLCTVGRTVEIGTPIATRVREDRRGPSHH